MRRTTRRLVALSLWLAAPCALALAQPDPEALRQAKALFFDRQYDEARSAWQGILDSGGGKEAEPALYWVARCSESLGESERALSEYGRYLAARPTDKTLAEEAKTSRVALSVKLAKAGKPAHVAIARDSLKDASRTVRYFAALQVASLGVEQCKPAVPVLQEIISKEKDDDLVERAKLALLRCDRNALPAAAPAPASAPNRARGQATWVRVRIYEKGHSKPNVAINVPVALADLVFKALPDEAIQDLRKEGYDARSFWEAVKKTGPAEILTVEGKDGERIQVWLE
jgi:tetratricopeptide (TPR) repeat protein